MLASKYFVNVGENANEIMNIFSPSYDALYNSMKKSIHVNVNKIFRNVICLTLPAGDSSWKIFYSSENTRSESKRLIFYLHYMNLNNFTK